MIYVLVIGSNIGTILLMEYLCHKQIISALKKASKNFLMGLYDDCDEEHKHKLYEAVMFVNEKRKSKHD